jgi:hypothetical protein
MALRVTHFVVVMVVLCGATLYARAAQDGNGAEPFTLHVTTREVVAEVVATGSHGRPITDLSADDFKVFELGPHGQKVEEKITVVHFVDPAAARGADDASPADYMVALGKTCATQTAPYYMVAYRVGQKGWTSGFHEILVTTSREHIKLSFRHRYYVGATAATAKAADVKAAQGGASMQGAACYHSDVPASMNLTGRLIQTGDTDGVQFSIAVQADSLAFTSLTDGPRRAEFDYGICTFDSAGIPLRYMQTLVDRVLSPEEYAQTLARGFSKLLAFRRIGDPAFARFVVRDRATGNLGSVGVVIPPVPEELRRPGTKATGGVMATGSEVEMAQNEGGPVSSFGLPIPKPGALCGDVYELPPGIQGLPDFWKMEPVGALYTDSLNVPAQLIMGTIGIPGVTTRTAWFGVDYYGEFWVKAEGEYLFNLASDDGSQLFIDDQMILNDDGVHPVSDRQGKVKLSVGRHTIHVPYFQGPPRSVALVLLVKPPGGKFRPFDVREFGPPEN